MNNFIFLYFLISGITLLLMMYNRIKITKRPEMMELYRSMDTLNKTQFGENEELEKYIIELNTAMSTGVFIKRIVLSILLYPLVMSFAIISGVFMFIIILFDKQIYGKLRYSKPMKGFNTFCRKNLIW